MGSVKMLVPQNKLSKPVSITEGEFVYGKYKDLGGWFPGCIANDDGDFKPGVPSSRYAPRGSEE
jgi:hypothetical protein